MEILAVILRATSENLLCVLLMNRGEPVWAALTASGCGGYLEQSRPPSHAIVRRAALDSCRATPRHATPLCLFVSVCVPEEELEWRAEGRGGVAGEWPALRLETGKDEYEEVVEFSRGR